MADLTLGTLIDLAGVEVGDTNTTNPGIDSVTRRKLANKWYQFMKTAFGMDVKGATSVSFAQGDTIATSLTTTNAQLQFVRAINVNNGLDLKILSVHEIQEEQRSKPTQGTINKIALEVLGDTVLFWNVFPHPIPDTAHGIALYFRPPIAELATDGSADGTVLKLSAFEERGVVLGMAQDMCPLLGREGALPGKIDKQLDVYLQLAQTIKQTRLRPRAESEKVGS